MIMCDTSFVIDLLRKQQTALDILRKNLNEPLFSTEITIMELYYGIESNKLYDKEPKLREKRLFEISEVIHHFTILPFDRNSAVKTASIMGILKKSGNMIDFRDGMIAGISLSNGISKLVTNNKDHFARIDGLSII